MKASPIRVLVSAGILVVLLAADNVSANASGPDPLEPICTDEQVRVGYCAPFLAMPGQEPAVEAVRQLALQGQTHEAALFAETAIADDQALEGAINAVLQDPQPAVLSNSTAAARFDDGHVYGGVFWSFDDFVEYGYCTPNGCSHVGTVSVQVNYSIVDYPAVVLDGYFGVGSGPAIQPETVTCKTFYEVWPFDQVLHEWDNCTDAQSPSYLSTRTLFPATWGQGSTVGTTYHLEFQLRFKVLGDPSNTVIGGLFNSQSYEIASGIGNSRFI